MKRYRKYIITVEGYNPFCPTPAPFDGFDHLNDANRMANKIAMELSAKERFAGKAVTVWNTLETKYEKIIEL